VASTKDIRSQIKLEIQEKGAAQTQKKLEGINKALSPSKMTGGLDAMERIMKRNTRQMAQLQKHVEGLAKTFTSLEKTVDRLGKAMEKTGMGGGGRRGGGAGAGAGGGGKPPKPPKPFFSDKDYGPTPPPGWKRDPNTGNWKRPQDPSFLRGILQGSGLGDYFPQDTKKGMFKQAAGNVVGQFLKGSASRGAQIYGGIHQMPFSGMQGLQQAAQGIPFVGGILSGALSEGQAAATRNLEYQRSKIPLGGFLGAGGFRSMAGAEASAQEARQRVLARGITPATAQDIPAQIIAAEERTKFENRLPGDKHGNVMMPGEITPSGLAGGGELANVGRARTEALNEENKKRQQALEDEADRAASAERAKFDVFGRTAQIGREFGGKNATESNQFATQLLQRGGGTLQGALDSGALKQAMAAQTVFGVGPEATGAFLKGSRRGGIVGGRSAGENMEDAIRQGISAGMDTTEVRDFLEQIAQGQESFIRTGIPINPKSIAGLTQAFGSLGVARGGNLATAMTGAAQQVGAHGPQDAMDFLMLQKLGGFQGGGLGDLAKAMENMEDLSSIDPSKFMDLIKTISNQAGGGQSGLFSIKRALGDKGANLRFGELRKLQAQATGDMTLLSPEERADVMGQGRGNEMGPPAPTTDLAQKILSQLSPGVGKQADIDNIMTFAGGKLLPAMQDLEESQADTVKALTAFTPELKALSKHSLEVAKALPGLADKLQKLLEGLMSFFGSADPNILKGHGKG
jgi:hypothetical protein